MTVRAPNARPRGSDRIACEHGRRPHPRSRTTSASDAPGTARLLRRHAVVLTGAREGWPETQSRRCRMNGIECACIAKVVTETAVELRTSANGTLWAGFSAVVGN